MCIPNPCFKIHLFIRNVGFVFLFYIPLYKGSHKIFSGGHKLRV